ncbi:MAG: hypothetical protein PHE29_04735 [Tissierellia bacterium]|nr:hypothetical protein [Tissierellia bacterium]
MMKNRILILIATVIIIIALLIMGINRLIVAMPDWIVRIIGIVIMVDLAVLVYSSVRNKHGV